MGFTKLNMRLANAHQWWVYHTEGERVSLACCMMRCVCEAKRKCRRHLDQSNVSVRVPSGSPPPPTVAEFTHKHKNEHTTTKVHNHSPSIPVTHSVKPYTALTRQELKFGGGAYTQAPSHETEPHIPDVHGERLPQSCRPSPTRDSHPVAPSTSAHIYTSNHVHGI